MLLHTLRWEERMASCQILSIECPRRNLPTSRLRVFLFGVKFTFLHLFGGERRAYSYYRNYFIEEITTAARATALYCT